MTLGDSDVVDQRVTIPSPGNESLRCMPLLLNTALIAKCCTLGPEHPGGGWVEPQRKPGQVQTSDRRLVRAKTYKLETGPGQLAPSMAAMELGHVVGQRPAISAFAEASRMCYVLRRAPRTSPPSLVCNSFKRHLWYFVEELVGLAMFDEDLDVKTKIRIEKNLFLPAKYHHRKRSRSISPSPDHKRNRRTRSRDRYTPLRPRPALLKLKPRLRRSRSRDRLGLDRDRRRRSHSRDRKRGDSKEKRCCSSKSKFKRDRSRSNSKDRDKKDDKDEDCFDPSNLDKEEEQKRLESEMQKRRERIERWRAERKKKELEITKKEIKGSILLGEKAELCLTNLQLPMKKWTLEDDSDEEEEKQENKEKQDNKENKEEQEEEEEILEEVDPLDAFMQEVQEEVRKVNKIDGKKPDGKIGGAPVNTNSSGVVIVSGVAKKKADKKKGELIEQNQDGLEVDSTCVATSAFAGV
uniref:Uncharacterized protein n=1 Tax=Timema poppense TaxID=170557 RepID=A0A7R9CV72_TIMPO|nr:unnamed protein product [Timema poppensis]